MSQEELLNNKELQAQIQALSENKEMEEVQLGRFGRMAMDNLQENNRQRFMSLKMQGKLMRTMLEIENEAKAMMEKIQEKMLKEDPMPQTEDIMERTRHLNKIRAIAEEIVLRDIVLA